MKFIQKFDHSLNCEVIEILDDDGGRAGKLVDRFEAYAFIADSSNYLYTDEIREVADFMEKIRKDCKNG